MYQHSCFFCTYDRWETWDHLDQLEIHLLSQRLGMWINLFGWYLLQSYFQLYLWELGLNSSSGSCIWKMCFHFFCLVKSKINFPPLINSEDLRWQNDHFTSTSQVILNNYIQQHGLSSSFLCFWGIIWSYNTVCFNEFCLINNAVDCGGVWESHI